MIKAPTLISVLSYLLIGIASPPSPTVALTVTARALRGRPVPARSAEQGQFIVNVRFGCMYHMIALFCWVDLTTRSADVAHTAPPGFLFFA
jgi:hypothetical protein